jgi:transcriptional regulator with XRE-family HTH domain
MGKLKDSLILYKDDHQDITWADMADAIGISFQSLLNYINGKVTPRASTLTMIAKVLEVPIDELRDAEEELEEAEEDLLETVTSEADEEELEDETEEDEKTTVHVIVGNTKPKMTVRDICETVVSDLKITFDEDPHRGEIDVIIPVGREPADILGERILNLEVNLIMAKGDALVISTNSRR